MKIECIDLSWLFKAINQYPWMPREISAAATMMVTLIVARLHISVITYIAPDDEHEI